MFRDIDLQDTVHSRTALHWAFHYLHKGDAASRAADLHMLVEAGASVNLADKHGRTPLWEAILQKDLAGVQLLLVHGAQPEDNGADKSQPAMMIMTDKTSKPALRLSADSCAVCEIDVADKDGMTALLHAGEQRNFDIMRLLIAHGADVGQRFRNGQTLLHSFPAGDYRQDSEDSVAQVDFLLTAGAEVDARDLKGHTPLMLCHSGNVALRLIAAGADLEARDARGRTPLGHAVVEYTAHKTQALIKAGADVSACFNGGDTPLLDALSCEHLQFRSGQLGVLRTFCGGSSSQDNAAQPSLPEGSSWLCQL
ncbi:hypothetical protein WJX72_000181 [[Myrmecia] bisecta]|uniref:Ankyrin repeat protein n=1 Tax=[Myrmecia] bisecta TaxID=41462 RepID=A0AAW1P8A1_9CHLO